MLYPLSYGRWYPNDHTISTSSGAIRLSGRTRRAETRGFEPPVPFSRDNSLAVSPIRPLWHVSWSQVLADSRAEDKDYTNCERSGKSPGRYVIGARRRPRFVGVTLRIRPDLDSLPAYVPGKTFPGALKLASNEVTEPPLPAVAAAITAAAAGVNRYPDNGAVALTEALATHVGVGAEEIQTAGGSVTLCQNLITITSGPGDEVLFGWRSFETYPLATRVTGATPVQVPLTGDAAYDLSAMADAITDRTRLIFVCNPNNPTGTVVEAAALRAFLERVPSDLLVVLDEAYIEYARLDDAHAYDAIELRKEFGNLVVLRTFSKAYGLAGLRVGYAVAAPEVVVALSKVHIPFSVNSLAQAAAIAAIGASDQLLERTDAVAAERTRVTAALREAGYRVAQSQANFVWLELGDDAAPFAADAAAAGLVVRPFAGEGVRVTVTVPEENDTFLAFARTRGAR